MNNYDKGEIAESYIDVANDSFEASGYDNSIFIEDDYIFCEGDISENDNGYDQSVFEP